ncbi:hypothetical protein [Actinophytocola sediminis]
MAERKIATTEDAVAEQAAQLIPFVVTAGGRGGRVVDLPAGQRLADRADPPA